MSPSQGSYRRGPPSLLRVLVPLVPRTLRYLAALRLPHTRRPRLLSFRLGLPRRRLLLLRGKPRADADALPSEACTTALRFAGLLHRGDVGISRVAGPSFAHAPWSITPPDAPCPRPDVGHGAAAFRWNETLGIRNSIISWPQPHGSCARAPTHRRHRYLCRRKARFRSAGRGFDRTGFSPAGRLLRISRSYRLLPSQRTDIARSHRSLIVY